MLSRVDRTLCWRWSSVQHPGQSHPVTLWLGWRWLLWLLWLVLCLLLIFHNFLRSANASECCSPVPYTIQWEFHSIPFFCSLQNLYMYTFSIVALASSLYLNTSFAFLLSEVALHVHNTSKHAFFCKHVNHKKNPASLCESKKIKKKVLLGLEPSTLLSNSLSKPFSLLRHRIACKIYLVNTNNCMA